MTRYGVFPGMTESIGPMAGENHLYPGAERCLPLVGYARISLVDLVN